MDKNLILPTVQVELVRCDDATLLARLTDLLLAFEETTLQEAS